ncbi:MULTISPECIES: DUF305 domain-containing protein [unclassified Erwinia]|uniref:CopM family metallochaperone n=1 Tax=unclassified Erwinia TaxID=2622719 RepID=UPI000830F419|nr:DUF305 domain-containing protein [Erwinia sp. ErVv1]
MNIVKTAVISTLLLSAAAMADDTMSMPDRQAQGTAAQHSYQSGMDKMHHSMQKGMTSHDPDVAFANGMTAHHQGAIDMAKTELKYGKDPEMRRLAEAIINAQQPEIDQMQAWLKKQKK